MSDEDAPSNISPQSIGEISALEGNTAKNSRPLGLEGAAGLQLLDIKDGDDSVDGLMGLLLTLGEWMRFDSGIIEEDQISDRTLKLLAAHHASSSDLIDTPMLSLIQVEPVFVPPKTKIYCTISDKGNSEKEEEAESESEAATKEETKKEGEGVIPQLKITEGHVAGVKTDLSKRKPWGNPTRWLLATGMGKSNKHPFMKSSDRSLWSISSRVHGTGTKWKELAALNPHIRNPNVIFPNETMRLR